MKLGMKKLASLSAVVALSAVTFPFGQARATTVGIGSNPFSDKHGSSNPFFGGAPFSSGKENERKDTWPNKNSGFFRRDHDDKGTFPTAAFKGGKDSKNKGGGDKDPKTWALGLTFADWDKKGPHHKKHHHKHHHKPHPPSEVPLPGALPLMGSVVGGGFLLRRWRSYRRKRTGARRPA